MEKVNVKKIVEYHTKFGSPGCRLLDYIGINFYTSTPEMIMDVLQKSADDPNMLKICSSGYCGGLVPSPEFYISQESHPFKTIFRMRLATVLPLQ